MTSASRPYKGFTPRLGVYRVLHHRTGKMLIGHSPHLTGTLNRLRFQLDLGNRPNRSLQQDWNLDGAGGFTFEVLDELTPLEPLADPTDDLRELLALWRENLRLRPEDEY
ncbi:GIY-YIG nuclease family protein [Deinococcus aluminii]|uniref:GIY-YIG nuclease family protein n=1 Tax=Deinococcus aluminii TaxID=1656885 RepID=A0ABP9XCR5_9DEIO